MAESIPVPKVIVLGPGQSKQQGAAKIADLRWSWVEEFFRSRELALNTRKAYEQELKRFLLWTEKPWQGVTHRDIDRYKAYLQTSTSARGGKPSAAATINRALAGLQSFFKWLTVKDYIPRNPTLTLEKPKPDPILPQELTAAEVEALYRALEYRGETETRDTALLRVLEHGLRASEVAALNVGDYNGTRLQIRQAKAGSVGSMPLLKDARRSLDAYLGWRVREGLPTNRDAPLFLSCSNNSKGKRLGYRGIYNMIEELAAIAGVEECHPHRLRHTFSTKVVMKMDTLLARQLTRHKSESSVIRYSKRALELRAHQQFYEVFGEEEPE